MQFCKLTKEWLKNGDNCPSFLKKKICPIESVKVQSWYQHLLCVREN